MDNSVNNPYVGTRSFTEEDAPLYFGRERETRDLLGLVAYEQVVVFYAQSGTGKSSLINARLIPNLETIKGFEVLTIGRVTGDVPSDAEIDNVYVYNLMRSLVASEVDSNVLAHMRLKDFLPNLVRDRNSEKRKYHFVENQSREVAAGEGQKRKRRVMVIDQFEELFTTRHEEWQSRADFFEQLAEALEADPYLWVVLSMREDYIAYLDPYAHLMPGGLRVRYYMQRMEYEDALKAVKYPAEKGGRPFAEEVAEHLVNDFRGTHVRKIRGKIEITRGQHVEPIVLQAVCSTLWENTDGAEITLENIVGLDVDKALGKYYEKRVRDVADLPEVREKGVGESDIRNWFGSQLITGEGNRNIVVRKRGGKTGGLDDDVVQIFSNQKDLVRAEQRGGATFYELTHDRLVGPIIANNKQSAAEGLKNLSPLQKQAALWNDEKRDEKWLLRDRALDDVEQWANDHQDSLTETEVEFLEISRRKQKERHEARDKRIARNRNLITVTSIVISLAMLVLAAFGILSARQAVIQAATAQAASTSAVSARADAEQQAKIARSRELSERAIGQLEIKTDLAILLGIEAYRANDNSQTQDTLLTTLEKSAGIRNFLYLNQAIDAQLSPDGKTIATLDEEGVILWDLGGKKLRDPFLGLPSPIYSTAFSPNGKILAASDVDGNIILWDAETHQPLGEPLTKHSQWVNRVAFTADGKILASASDDRTIILWDLSKTSQPEIIGSPITPFEGGYGVNDLAISPTSNFIAAGSPNGDIVMIDISDTQNTYTTKNSSEYSKAIYDLAFSPDGKLLASGSSDGKFTLWDASKPQLSKLREMEVNESIEILSLAISRNGRTLAVGSQDGSITLWNIWHPRLPVLIGKPLKGHTDVVRGLAFNSDGKILASGSYDGQVILWDLDREKILTQVMGHSAHRVNSVAYNQAGDTLVASTSNGAVILWDVSNTEKPLKIGSLQGPPSKPDRMEFSLDGRFLAIMNTMPLYYSFADSSVLVDVIDQSLIGAGRVVFQDPDGKFLISQGYDDAANTYVTKLFDTATGQVIGKPIPGLFLTINLDKRIIGYETINNSGNASINLWDLGANKQLGRSVEGNLLAISQDGEILAYSDNKNTDKMLIGLVAVEEGNPIGTLEGEFIGIDSTSKKLLYSTINEEGQPEIILWDMINQKAIDSHIGNSPVLSPDGRTLLYQTADSEGKILYHLLDTATGSSIGNPILSGDYSYAIFSPDSKILLYQTVDNAGKTLYQLLDTATGSSVGSALTPDPYSNSTPIFSPDGKILSYQTYDSSEEAYYFVFFDIATNRPINSRIKGEAIIDTHQENNILVYQISSSEGQKIIAIDTESHVQIGEPIRGEFKSLLQNGGILVYQDEAGIKQLNLASSDSTINREPIKGRLLSVSPDGSIWLVRNGDSIEIRDVNQPIIPGINLTSFKGELQGNLQTAALSPDGTRLAVSDAGDILLWDTVNETLIGEPFNHHAGTINFVQFSRNGKFLAASGSDGKITVWNFANREKILGPLQGSLATFSPNERMLAVGDYNTGTTTLWDLTTFKQIGDVIPGSSATFSSNEQILAVGDSNTTTLWDLTTLKQIGDSIPGYSPVFSSDDRILAVGDSTTNTTTLWDLTTFKQIEVSLPGYLTTFISNDRSLVVAGHFTTTLWDLTTFQQIGDVIPGSSATFSSNEQLLAVADYNTHTTTLWDLTTFQQIGDTLPGYYQAFSSNDRILAVGDSNTNTITLWDLTTFRQIGDTLPGSYPSFSPDGSILVINNYQSSDTITTLWNLSTMNQIGGGNYAFSPDGNLIAYSNDKGIVVWNKKSAAAPGQPSRVYPGIISGMSFTPDSDTLVIYGNSGYVFWNMISGEMDSQPSASTGNVNALRFSPDGRYLASVADDGVIISNVASREKVSGPIPGNGVVFSQDGNIIAVLNSDDTISLWNTTEDTRIGEPIAGTAPVFFPKRPILATTNDEASTIALWDLHTLEELTKDDPIFGNKILFSPDATKMSIINWTSSVNQSEVAEGTPTPTVERPRKPRKLGIALYDITSIEPKNIDDLTLSCPPEHIDCRFVAAFSPDGKTLAYSNSGEIYLWDIGKRMLIGKPFTVANAVTNLAFIRNGQYLISEDSNGFTTIWDLSSFSPFGEPIQGYFQLEGSYPNNDTFLISNSEDLFLWKFDPIDWIDQLCSKVKRNFTSDEWIQNGFTENEIYPTNQDDATCPQWLLEPEPITTP